MSTKRRCDSFENENLNVSELSDTYTYTAQLIAMPKCNSVSVCVREQRLCVGSLHVCDANMYMMPLCRLCTLVQGHFRYSIVTVLIMLT